MVLLLQLIEEFNWKAYDLLGKLEQLREVLSNPELPDDLQGSKVRSVCLSVFYSFISFILPDTFCFFMFHYLSFCSSSCLSINSSIYHHVKIYLAFLFSSFWYVSNLPSFAMYSSKFITRDPDWAKVTMQIGESTFDFLTI